MEIIRLAHDELEALHLCDGKDKSQIEAGICMGVSRGTIQRLLSSARCKVAQALVGQKALAITGERPGPGEGAVAGQVAGEKSESLDELCKYGSIQLYQNETLI